MVLLQTARVVAVEVPTPAEAPVVVAPDKRTLLETTWRSDLRMQWVVGSGLHFRYKRLIGVPQALSNNTGQIFQECQPFGRVFIYGPLDEVT